MRSAAGGHGTALLGCCEASRASPQVVSEVLGDDAVLVGRKSLGDDDQPVDQFGGQVTEVHLLELFDRVPAFL